MIGAVEGVHSALEAVKVAEDTGHAAQQGDRRIVGVERQGDACFLSHRQDPFQVVDIVGPHLVGAENAPMGQLIRVVFDLAEARAVGAAAAAALARACARRRWASSGNPE